MKEPPFLFIDGAVSFELVSETFVTAVFVTVVSSCAFTNAKLKKNATVNIIKTTGKLAPNVPLYFSIFIIYIY